MTNTQVFRLGGDLAVRRIGYGAMRLANAPHERSGMTAPIWTAPTDRAESIALLRKAVDLGVNLFDTADAYALGANEELLAEALQPHRDDVVIATKVGVLRPSPAEWITHGHPAYLRQQAELGLRRLRTDRLDLLYLHRIDPAYPLADQIGALRQLQEEGKVRHIGLSEVSVAEIEEAARIVPIASVQNVYNLAERGHDPVIDHTAGRGIAFVPYFPVSGGDQEALSEVAAELGATPSQTALAWLLHRSPNVLPIPGTSSPAHLAENAGALELALTEAQFKRLAE
ncbi:aryl-alcohol dehydrogenase-like predicted oxidoreductase [Streptomyces sp. TLI_55]|uniref:aldo/keto reductase n=1 Tax=Streptomyces sp. TLI_55 TaxID=1938861 RepID=UPI000BDB6997|nr:aldo/keto reductase [Streptomyces sp. TLI_55]SNX57736.1 aryl-alcohol dehydrogenase-like predicted oxidoreductase [Streptomyces sp. TLI_55]